MIEISASKTTCQLTKLNQKKPENMTIKQA